MFVSSMHPVIQLQNNEIHQNVYPSPPDDDDDEQQILVNTFKSI
jgi:hypothetical protein